MSYSNGCVQRDSDLVLNEEEQKSGHCVRAVDGFSNDFRT